MLLIAILTKDQEREKKIVALLSWSTFNTKEGSHLDRLIDGRLRN